MSIHPLSAAVLWLAAAVSLPAQTFNLNPGPPGTISSDITLPFSQLNGTPIDGRSLNLTVQFPATAPLSLYSNSATNYLLYVILQTNSAGTPPGFMTGSGHLVDAMGGALGANMATGGGSSSAGTFFTALVFNGANLASTFAYHWGASYALTLPNDPGLMVTGASFRIISQGGSFYVGPHGALPVATPENGSTFALLLLTLFALTAGRRNRCVTGMG